MASTHARRALDMVRAVSAQAPASRESRRQVSVRLRAVGGALRADGDLQAALTVYREGLEIVGSRPGTPAIHTPSQIPCVAISWSP